jgi:hypothetical protein
MPGDFLKGLSADRYSRISDLLDESIDMVPSDREAWLAALEKRDPQSASVLRRMFAARCAVEADGFLEEMPLVPRKFLLTMLIGRLAARLWALSPTGPLRTP